MRVVAVAAVPNTAGFRCQLLIWHLLALMAMKKKTACCRSAQDSKAAKRNLMHAAVHVNMQQTLN